MMHSSKRSVRTHGVGLTVPMAVVACLALPAGSALAAANDGEAAGVMRIAAAPAPVTTELPPDRPGSNANTNTNSNVNSNTDTNTTATGTDSTAHADDSFRSEDRSEAERREQAERSREVAAEVRAEAERERAEERARGAAERGAAAGERAAARARAAAERDASSRESDEQHAKVEAQLRDAQARLQAAAQEVSRLSAEVSRSVMQKFNVNWWQHAVIGLVVSYDNDPAGAHVVEVSPGGAAADAGLKAGDVIVSINGVGMGGPAAARKVVDAVQSAGPNGKLKMHIRRDNKDQDFLVVARAPAGFGTVPFVFTAPPAPAAPAAPAAPPAPPAPGAPNVTYGPFNFSYAFRGLGSMELATLTPELGHYFGTDKGVLVVRAPKDSSFKLQDGDVILSIDGRDPISGSHATRILASYQPGEKVVLHIMREHKAMNVETKLPDYGQGMHRPARSVPRPEANS